MYYMLFFQYNLKGYRVCTSIYYDKQQVLIFKYNGLMLMSEKNNRLLMALQRKFGCDICIFMIFTGRRENYRHVVV